MTNPSSTGLVVTTPSDREILMSRVFDAPRHLVFDAFTRCEHLKRWWGPRRWSLPVCEIDLRPGGAWRFLMRGDDGSEMGMYGEYREVERPARLVQTEQFEGDMFEAMGSGTVNTFTLEERDGKTFFNATVVYKSREARDGVLQTPMKEGLAETFNRLEELLTELARCR